MSQSFLDAFVPRIAPAFDAVARNPGHSVVLERLTSFCAPELLADRGGPTWRRLVGRGLPMGDAEIQALERCADAMLEAQIHRVVRVPGAWCALGEDGLSPALLPHGEPRPPRDSLGPMLREALRRQIRCALLGADVPPALLAGLSAHRRAALAEGRDRLEPILPRGRPDPLLVWSDGTIAAALSVSVVEMRPAGVVPLEVLAVARLHPPSPAQGAPPAESRRAPRPSRRIPR